MSGSLANHASMMPARRRRAVDVCCTRFALRRSGEEGSHGAVHVLLQNEDIRSMLGHERTLYNTVRRDSPPPWLLCFHLRQCRLCLGQPEGHLHSAV
jgi:hypothetical protein